MKKISEMRVVITGATGLIGTNLATRLLSENAEVIVIGRSIEKLKQAFKHTNKKLVLFEHNIENTLPKSLGNIDLIFHAASPTSGAFIKKYPVDTINSNINGIINCLEFLRNQKETNDYNARLIVFSSATIYGNNSNKDSTLGENDTMITGTLSSSNAAYAESKRMMEVIANAYFAQYGIEVVIARLSYVYGFSVCPANTAFNSFLKTAIAGENIIIQNPEMPRRDNIYVDDAIEGLLTIAVKGESGEVYNISSGNAKDGFKAADEIASYIVKSVKKFLSGNNSKVIIERKSENRDKGIILSNDKLRRLGWDIKYSIENGILCTVKKYLEKEEMI